MTDGTSPRVPIRERTPDIVNKKRDGCILTEILVLTYRYPRKHRAMDVIALVITES